MNHSQRLLETLNFIHPQGGGAVLETFFPWDLTVDRWCDEGLPKEFASKRLYPVEKHLRNRYLNDCMADSVYNYEQFLGFDGVKRMSFRIPFQCFEEETEPVIKEEEDFYKLKEKVIEYLYKYCSDEDIKEVYRKYKDGNETGDFSIRFRVAGFFWTPRMLMGIEEHLFAYYDMPKLIKELNQFVVDTYKKYLDKIFDIIKPEVILIEEDLSGCNGPMISPAIFDEFVAVYYKQLFPFLKEKGVKNIFIDTDGDFNQLIPNFIKAGVDGFLPMDVNAGMDIVKVRAQYPNLKFIGGFNKLKIAEGKEAIDKEFERLLPVIRQGGYVPGCDHQVAPSTPLENYLYYIEKLKCVMGRK